MRFLGALLGLCVSIGAAFYAGMLHQRDRDLALVSSVLALSSECIGQLEARIAQQEDAARLLRFYRRAALGCGLREDQDTEALRLFLGDEETGGGVR